MQRLEPDPWQIEVDQEQGAVVLRGIFADWVETIRRGIDRDMAEPGPHGTDNVRPQDGGGHPPTSPT